MVLVDHDPRPTLLRMEPAFGGDIDPVNDVTTVVQVIFDRNGAFIGDHRLAEIAAGDKCNGRLHEGRQFSAKKRKGPRFSCPHRAVRGRFFGAQWKHGAKNKGEDSIALTLFFATGNITRLYSVARGYFRKQIDNRKVGILRAI